MIYQKVSYLFTLDLKELRTDQASSGAFYMVGDIDSARQKGEKILADLDKS